MPLRTCCRSLRARSKAFLTAASLFFAELKVVTFTTVLDDFGNYLNVCSFGACCRELIYCCSAFGAVTYQELLFTVRCSVCCLALEYVQKLTRRNSPEFIV